MPNYVHTDVVITGKKKYMQDLLSKYTSEKDGKKVIDFNLIIPEPKSLEDCPEEFIIHNENEADSAGLIYDLSNERRWFNWYEWRIKNWYTKWNARYSLVPNLESLDDETDYTYLISWDTAWSPALLIFDKLMELYPELDFKFGFCDESYNFCGIYSKTECRGAEPDANFDPFATEVEEATKSEFGQLLCEYYSLTAIDGIIKPSIPNSPIEPIIEKAIVIDEPTKNNYNNFNF